MSRPRPSILQVVLSLGAIGLATRPDLVTALSIAGEDRAQSLVEFLTRLYRAVDAVGRWSMIDVFVVGLLTALVSVGRLATVEPGPGITAFAATVVFTMFAAHHFDARLLWDRAGARHVHPVRRIAAAPGA